MIFLIKIFAIAADKLKQSKPMTKIFKSNQPNYTNLYILTWSNLLISVAFWVWITFSPLQTILLKWLRRIQRSRKVIGWSIWRYTIAYVKLDQKKLFN